ncbi:MAG: hypothetical protein U9N14_07660 [Pseudomonadota bacterium]|nr:hypothetical protein [Pseudomonadota bacterium]
MENERNIGWTGCFLYLAMATLVSACGPHPLDYIPKSDLAMIRASAITDEVRASGDNPDKVSIEEMLAKARGDEPPPPPDPEAKPISIDLMLENAKRWQPQQSGVQSDPVPVKMSPNGKD